MEVKNYKNFVILIKILCITTTLLIIGILFVVPQFTKTKNQISFVSNNNKPDQVLEKVEVIEPNILGYSQDNGPYQISADKIIQKSDVLLLEKIKARVVWKNQKNFEISAQNASIRLIDKNIKIYGNVIIKDWYNHANIKTESLYISEKNNIYSDQPFIMESINETLKGTKGFMLARDKNEAEFFGPVNLNTNHSKEGKIEISAQKKVFISLNTQKIIFESAVNFKIKKLQITSDTMVADYFTNNRSYAFTNIKFNNNVKIVSGKDKVATADHAEYILNQNKILLQDNIKLKEGKNIISADSLIYDTKTQNFIIKSNSHNSNKDVEVIIKKHD